MNKIIGYIVSAVLLVLATACEDSRMNFMVDDSIYLLTPGFVETDIINWGDYTHNVYVIKSGKGQQGARVTLSPDQSVLDEYNSLNLTSYKLLPDSYYTIRVSGLDMGKNDYREAFEIDFKASEMALLQSSGTDTYVLPLRMNIADAPVTAEAENLTTLLFPVVKEPYIGIKNAGLYLPGLSYSASAANEMVLYITTVNTNFHNPWDISFTLEADRALLDDYNANGGNSTKYEMLPADAYEIDQSAWVIPALNNERDIKIKVKKKGLIPEGGNYFFGNYVLPIRLSSVSKAAVDPEKSFILYPVIFQPGDDLELDRSNWEVIDYNSCISEEEHYISLNRTPDKMLDGDVATFWGSKWDAPKPLPYYFVFDMKAAYSLYAVGFVKPDEAWRGNVKAGYFEASPDNATWTKIHDWQLDSNTDRSHKFNVSSVSARYIRFVITEAFDYDNPEVGLESGARCDIAEFKVWGSD